MLNNTRISPNSLFRPITLRRFILHPSSFILVLFILHPSSFIRSQVVDTIKANPNAVELRPVWVLNGTGNDMVGDGVGYLPDINGDSISEVAVFYAKAHQLRVFYGGTPIPSQPAFIINGIGYGMCVGNFYGTGEKTFGVAMGQYDSINNERKYHWRFGVMKIDSSRIDTVPKAMLDWKNMNMLDQVPKQEIAADLDEDGADELIVMDEIRIWIYRGGPGFQLDTPTIVLHNDDLNNPAAGTNSFYVGKLSHNARPGIVTRLLYTNSQIPKYKFWFGTQTSPWTWDTTKPDRTLLGTSMYHAFVDSDGDGIVDLAQLGPNNHVNMFLTDNGKDYRTRTLDSLDVDKAFIGLKPDASFGYLSDSLKRYEMLGLWGSTVWGLGGGKGGPDQYYDAYASQLAVLGSNTPIPDVTGDSWNDYITGYSQNNFNAGIAIVYAGGPYIPRDFDYAEVATDSSTYYNTGVYLYPQPATDELNIILHGTTPDHIARFCVMDVLGRCVAEGTADGGRRYQWCMSRVPSGRYQLVFVDTWGKIVHSKPVIIQR